MARLNVRYKIIFAHMVLGGFNIRAFDNLLKKVNLKSIVLNHVEPMRLLFEDYIFLFSSECGQP